MSQRVVRYYKENCIVQSGVAQAATITWAEQMLFSPGYYDYNGTVYDLTQPGLYRFFNPMVNTTHMVVSAGDPVAVLSAAAWLTSFGSDDDTLSLSQKMAQTRTSKLKMLCGPTIEYARQLMSDAGYTTRTVRFLTMETPNNYVDGHVGLEWWTGSEWLLADPSMNYLFKDGNGDRLSAKDAVGEIAADTFVYEPLAGDGYAVEPSSNFTFDATAYAEMFLLTETDRRDWHRRIFQAVGIDRSDGTTWWKLPAGSSGRKSWVEGLAPGVWIVKDAATWDAEFY